MQVSRREGGGQGLSEKKVGVESDTLRDWSQAVWQKPSCDTEHQRLFHTMWKISEVLSIFLKLLTIHVTKKH